MLRYDYHVPSLEEISGQDSASSTLLSPRVSSATASTSLLNAAKIRERLIARRKWLGLLLLIVVGIVAFSIFITYAMKNKELHQLEDVYPESSEKLTVLFPDEQARNIELPSLTTTLRPQPRIKHKKITASATDGEIPTKECFSIKLNVAPTPVATTVTAPPTSTVATATTQIDGLITTSPAKDGESTSQSTLETSDSKVQQSSSQSDESHGNESERQKSSRCISKRRHLPADADGRDPVDLLVNMAVTTDYTCFECDQQIFGVQLTLPLCNNTFGPYYGNGKKNTKKLPAAEACHFLFKLDYPKFQPTKESKDEGFNCHSTKC